jgi:transcriptional regulator with XRE-family HTH domain
MATETTTDGATGLPGLRAARRAKLLTQEELAREAGLNRVTIWQLETGIRNPQLSTIRRLTEALGVTPEQLLEPPPRPKRRAGMARGGTA